MFSLSPHLSRPLDADDISFAVPNGRMFRVCTPGKIYCCANSPPVDNHVEVCLVLVKRPEAMLTATEDDGHAVDHGRVEAAEAEAGLLFSVKVGKQVDAFVERVDYYIFLLNKIVCGPNIERLSLMLKK